MNATYFRDLIEVVKNTPDERWDPRFWWSSYEGKGCAIGNYVLAYRDRGLDISTLFPSAAISSHFDIPVEDVRMLFCPKETIEEGTTRHLSQSEMVEILRDYFERHQTKELAHASEGSL